MTLEVRVNLAEDKEKSSSSPAQFIEEVRDEMKKVSWPTKKELTSYTGVVGLAVVIVCALIWVCDTIFARLFHVLLS